MTGKINYTDLMKKHRWEDKGSLKTILARLSESDGLLLYRNVMLDSSLCGRQHLVIFGEGRTIPSIDKAPSWIDPDACGGLPSRREQLIGEVDVSDVRMNLSV